jgi:hypothetical protein
MSLWFPLLAAPALALLDQAVAYAAVGWACSHDRTFAVHMVHAMLLVATAAGTFPAWRLWQATAAGGGETMRRRHFLAAVAMASAALSALVIAAMWFPVFVIASCTE